jgi:hypothetical protein
MGVYLVDRDLPGIAAAAVAALNEAARLPFTRIVEALDLSM